MLPLLGGAIPDNGPRDYLPVFLLVIVAIGIAASQLAISWLLSPRTKPNPIKDSPYECGIEPTGEAHTRFSVKFYLVAVLFILFDIEIVFLYPWAVHFGASAKRTGSGELVRFLFVEMVVFLAILFLGWYWVVKKKALEWDEA